MWLLAKEGRRFIYLETSGEAPGKLKYTVFDYTKKPVEVYMLKEQDITCEWGLSTVVAAGQCQRFKLGVALDSAFCLSLAHSRACCKAVG